MPGRVCAAHGVLCIACGGRHTIFTADRHAAGTRLSQEEAGGEGRMAGRVYPACGRVRVACGGSTQLSQKAGGLRASDWQVFNRQIVG